ncbi:hypothetical protein [Hyphomicrobium sp.]|uniref:hypothetical protein n=1 Tax=Hyphomicrobium sp. TaxID=82 RepID=UPI0035624473
MSRTALIDPTRETPFGKLVGIIIKECGLSYRAAARLLKLSPNLLSDIVAGRKDATRRLIAERGWAEQLEKYDPEIWERHRVRFENLASKLASKARYHHSSPANHSTIGFVLWQILGGVAYDAEQAKLVLAIDRGRLHDILHGKIRLSQQYIAENDWVGRLQAHYADAWNEFGENFLRQVGQLQPRTRIIKSREPSDRTSFGYILWKILGGPYIGHSLATDVLGVSKHELRDLIYEKNWWRTTRIDLKSWRDVLAKEFPEQWQLHREQFDGYVK